MAASVPSGSALADSAGRTRMSRNLIVRPRSVIDVADIFDYFLTKSKRVAVRFLDAHDTAVSAIESDPEGGNRLVLPDLGGTQFYYRRPVGFGSYLIIYRFDGTTIEILRTMHASQNLYSLVDRLE